MFLNNFRRATPKNNSSNKNMHSYAANFFQIFVNIQKYWNNAMSNDGLGIERIDQTHGD